MQSLILSAAAGFLALFSSGVLADSSASASASFTPAQEKAVQKIVHDYLVSQPQVLMETAASLQKQQQSQWQETANKVVPQIVQRLFSAAESPVAGNPKGDVAIVEFFDYACPHCKDLSPKVQDIAANDHNLKIIFKQMPIFGGASEFAAKAVLASQKQGKSTAFHEALMKISQPLTQPIIVDTAKKLGLNMSQLEADMQKAEVGQELKQNYQLAKELKLTGTPAFVIAKISPNQFGKNPVLIPGAVSENILVEAVGQVRGK